MISSIANRAKLAATRTFVSVSPRPDVISLGTGYGAWAIPANELSSESVCYCFGVGEDISFDLALVNRFHCEVHAFDPTPRAVDFIKSFHELPPEITFHAEGIWDRDTIVKFFAPKTSEHVSHSIVNLQKTDQYFEAQVKSLGSFMRELGHTRVDLLKVDVEGAEYAVIEDMLVSGIRPRVVCVEFDQPIGILDPIRAVKKLRGIGYETVNVSSWNFTFVHGAES